MSWATLSGAERDVSYNNSNAVPNSPALNAAREQRSAAFRAAHPEHLDLAYGPRPRNRWDLFPARDPGAPCLVFIHGGYWQARTREEFACLVEGPYGLGWSAALAGYTLAPDATLTEIVAEVHARARLARRARSGPRHRRPRRAVRLVGGRASHGDGAGSSAGAGRPRHFRPLRDGADPRHLPEREAAADRWRTGDAIAVAAACRGEAACHRLRHRGASRLVADSRDLHARRAAAHAPGPLLSVPGADHFTVVLELQSPTGVLTRQLPLLLE